MTALLTSLRSGDCPDFDSLVDQLAPALPMLLDLAATPQDPEWHGEGDVHTHTAWVLREVYEQWASSGTLDADDRATLVLAAALHDIAKPLTTKQAERDGRIRIIAPRHADRGRSYLASRRWLAGGRTSVKSADACAGDGAGVWARVLALVGHHHDPRQLVVRDAQPAAYARLARACDTRLLYMLAVADMSGRACADKRERLDELELFRMMCQDHGCFGRDPYDDWRATFDADAPGWSPDHLRRALAQGIRDHEAGLIHAPHEAIARGYALEDARARLVVVCGPSGSGKSTWIAEHLPAAAVVSLDALRATISGDPADQSRNGQVRQEAMRLLRQHLAAGRTVAYDATNLRRDFRRDVVALGWDYRAFVEMVAFATDEPTCQARNQGRSRQVPRRVIERQFDTWQTPYLHEADTLRYRLGGP